MLNNNSNSILKTGFVFPVISILGILLGATTNQVQAATLSPSDPSAEGISYEWTVQMGNPDQVDWIGYVGARSWNEPANPPGLKGWTHTSNWVALELTEPVKLIVTIERAEGVPTFNGIAFDTLYPALSIYSGWQLTGLEDHQYNTVGNSQWADEIVYIAHEANKNGSSEVTGTFILSPGLYSIAIGGDPTDPLATGLQGYQASLSTTAVPEPLTILGAATAFGFGGIFKRKLLSNSLKD